MYIDASVHAEPAISSNAVGCPASHATAGSTPGHTRAPQPAVLDATHDLFSAAKPVLGVVTDEGAELECTLVVEQASASPPDVAAVLTGPNAWGRPAAVTPAGGELRRLATLRQGYVRCMHTSGRRWTAVGVMADGRVRRSPYYQ